MPFIQRPPVNYVNFALGNFSTFTTAEAKKASRRTEWFHGFAEHLTGRLSRVFAQTCFPCHEPIELAQD